MRIILIFTVITIILVSFDLKKNGQAAPEPSAPAFAPLNLDSVQSYPALAPEHKKMFEEIGVSPDIIQKEYYSPMVELEKKTKKGTDTFIKTAAWTAGFVKFVISSKNRMRQTAAWLTAAFIAAALLLWHYRLWNKLAIFSNFLCAGGMLLYMAASICSLWALYIFKSNLWEFNSYLMIWFPGIMIILGNTGLKLTDNNYPIANSLVDEMTAPLAQMLMIALAVKYIL